MTVDNRRPLYEVVAELFNKANQIKVEDERIAQAILQIERILHVRGVERIVSVKLPDGAELGWSQRYVKYRGRKVWRLVIRDDEEAIDLLHASAEERIEVFTCGAMQKLLKRALPDLNLSDLAATTK